MQVAEQILKTLQTWQHQKVFEGEKGFQLTLNQNLPDKPDNGVQGEGDNNEDVPSVPNGVVGNVVSNTAQLKTIAGNEKDVNAKSGSKEVPTMKSSSVTASGSPGFAEKNGIKDLAKVS